MIKNKQNPLKAPHLNERNSFKSLQDSVLRQIQLLKDISGKLNALELKYLDPRTHNPEGKQLFINEMDILYENILEHKETALLLQGYDFAGFLDWYRSNCQILRKKELSEDYSLLDEEFERDLMFFDVLVGSVDYLLILKKPCLIDRNKIFTALITLLRCPNSQCVNFPNPFFFRSFSVSSKV